MFSEAWINLLFSLVCSPAEEPLLHLSSFHPIFIYVGLNLCVCVLMHVRMKCGGLSWIIYKRECWTCCWGNKLFLSYKH